MASFSPGSHWRDTARNARFFVVDARAAFPLLLFILNIAWWTFITAVVTISFFAILERWGFTLPIFFRWLRNFIAGDYKTSSPWWRE